MARKKLKHFEQMRAWDHVFEPTLEDYGDLKGTWGERVILELACGKGHYTLALAERYPDATVIGVDIKGSRMWHGAGEALERGLGNVRFLRCRIEDLAEYFGEAEVEEIWITFPDPHPRKGKAKKRLTSERFLEIYKRILKPGGVVHLKTDDDGLFEWTLDVLLDGGYEVEVVRDVYAEGVDDELLHIKTDYESRFLEEGRVIKYLKADF